MGNIVIIFYVVLATSTFCWAGDCPTNEAKTALNHYEKAIREFQAEETDRWFFEKPERYFGELLEKHIPKNKEGEKYHRARFAAYRVWIEVPALQSTLLGEYKRFREKQNNTDFLQFFNFVHGKTTERFMKATNTTELTAESIGKDLGVVVKLLSE